MEVHGSEFKLNGESKEKSVEEKGKKRRALVATLGQRQSFANKRFRIYTRISRGQKRGREKN